MQDLADRGEVADYADLARLPHVSRARIALMLKLLRLPPDIPEAILFLPPTDGRRPPVRERHIQSSARLPTGAGKEEGCAAIRSRPCCAAPPPRPPSIPLTRPAA